MDICGNFSSSGTRVVLGSKKLPSCWRVPRYPQQSYKSSLLQCQVQQTHLALAVNYVCVRSASIVLYCNTQNQETILTTSLLLNSQRCQPTQCTIRQCQRSFRSQTKVIMDKNTGTSRLHIEMGLFAVKDQLHWTLSLIPVKSTALVYFILTSWLLTYHKH